MKKGGSEQIINLKNELKKTCDSNSHQKKLSIDRFVKLSQCYEYNYIIYYWIYPSVNV